MWGMSEEVGVCEVCGQRVRRWEVCVGDEGGGGDCVRRREVCVGGGVCGGMSEVGGVSGGLCEEVGMCEVVWDVCGGV